MSDNFIYDDIPYPSFTFSQTHPDHLATIAKFHGMTPQDVTNCRVLELGCGDGTNLNAMAYTLPTSKFVGIDLSRKHINDAKAAAEEIGIKNSEFYEADVMQVNAESFGKFDYIIAHGLFSWVPEFVREKVLQIYEEMLSENGVGYISYNVYPGCHLREITRNMMRFHVKDISESLTQVKESMNFLEFLTENVEPESLYQQLIQEELSKMVTRTPENIFHDDLSELNQAFYFADFIAKAESNGLQFLSEAEFFSSNKNHFPQQVQKMLAGFGDDVIKTEQYMDFVKARRFRQTLLCKNDIRINRLSSAEILRGFSISSQLKTESDQTDLRANIVEQFTSSKKGSFQIDHPLTKASLIYLGEVWSKRVAFAVLLETAAEKLKAENIGVSPEDFATTTAIFYQLFLAGFIELHVFEPQFVTKVSDKPLASKFACFQSNRGNSLTTLTGLTISINDDLIRKLFNLLDGKRDRETILAKLKEDESFRDIDDLGNFFDENLMHMARNGMLLA